MAVIRPPIPEGSSRDPASLRPAILIRNGSFQLDASYQRWTDLLEQHRHGIERAIRAVGRVETDKSTMAWAGTAFLVDPMRAVTATFIAKALGRKSTSGGASDNKQNDLEGVWINFKSEYGTTDRERVRIRDVSFVHPYWGFAFLELAQPVGGDRVLQLAPKQSEEELRDRDICVIGYPAFDVRNDPAVMSAIFGDVYDVKRLMPGKIIGRDRWGDEEAVALRHDATTTGGTSGSPVIDLMTADVLGVQVGGHYLVSNYAVPAWEIDRDPQWPIGSNSQADGVVHNVVAAALESIESTTQEEPILTFEEVLNLQDALVKSGVTDEDKIRILFAGLPKEYVGALPDGGGGPTERLLAMLHAMNEVGGRIGTHSAFYYVLMNAGRMRSWDSNWTQKVQVWLKMLLEREAKRT